MPARKRKTQSTPKSKSTTKRTSKNAPKSTSSSRTGKSDLVKFREEFAALKASLPKGQPVPAISVRQPWATMMLWIGKDIENRSYWPFQYRGPIVLHAARTPFDQDTAEAAIKRARADGATDDELWWITETGYDPDVIAFGAIVGVGILDDVVASSGKVPKNHPILNSPWANPDAGFWLHLSEMFPVNPVPWKGAVGLFKVPYEVVQGLTLSELLDA